MSDLNSDEVVHDLAVDILALHDEGGVLSEQLLPEAGHLGHDGVALGKDRALLEQELLLNGENLLLHLLVEGVQLRNDIVHLRAHLLDGGQSLLVNLAALLILLVLLALRLRLRNGGGLLLGLLLLLRLLGLGGGCGCGRRLLGLLCLGLLRCCVTLALLLLLLLLRLGGHGEVGVTGGGTGRRRVEGQVEQRENSERAASPETRRVASSCVNCPPLHSYGS